MFSKANYKNSAWLTSSQNEKNKKQNQIKIKNIVQSIMHPASYGNTSLVNSELWIFAFFESAICYLLFIKTKTLEHDIISC